MSKVRRGSGSAPCRARRELRTGALGDCEPRSAGDRLPDLLMAMANGDAVYVTEGEKDFCSLWTGRSRGIALLKPKPNEVDG